MTLMCTVHFADVSPDYRRNSSETFQLIILQERLQYPVPTSTTRGHVQLPCVHDHVKSTCRGGDVKFSVTPSFCSELWLQFSVDVHRSWYESWFCRDWFQPVFHPGDVHTAPQALSLHLLLLTMQHSRVAKIVRAVAGSHDYEATWRGKKEPSKAASFTYKAANDVWNKKNEIKIYNNTFHFFLITCFARFAHLPENAYADHVPTKCTNN